MRFRTDNPVFMAYWVNREFGLLRNIAFLSHYRPLYVWFVWIGLDAIDQCIFFSGDADRGEVQKEAAEIFFRKVKFWKEDGQEEAPPVFVGIILLKNARPCFLRWMSFYADIPCMKPNVKIIHLHFSESADAKNKNRMLSDCHWVRILGSSKT